MSTSRGEERRAARRGNRDGSNGPALAERIENAARYTWNNPAAAADAAGEALEKFTADTVGGVGGLVTGAGGLVVDAGNQVIRGAGYVAGQKWGYDGMVADDWFNSTNQTLTYATLAVTDAAGGVLGFENLDVADMTPEQRNVFEITQGTANVVGLATGAAGLARGGALMMSRNAADMAETAASPSFLRQFALDESGAFPGRSFFRKGGPDADDAGAKSGAKGANSTAEDSMGYTEDEAAKLVDTLDELLGNSKTTKSAKPVSFTSRKFRTELDEKLKDDIKSLEKGNWRELQQDTIQSIKDDVNEVFSKLNPEGSLKPHQMEATLDGLFKRNHPAAKTKNKNIESNQVKNSLWDNNRGILSNIGKISWGVIKSAHTGSFIRNNPISNALASIPVIGKVPGLITKLAGYAWGGTVALNFAVGATGGEGNVGEFAADASDTIESVLTGSGDFSGMFADQMILSAIGDNAARDVYEGLRDNILSPAGNTLGYTYKKIGNLAEFEGRNIGAPVYNYVIAPGIDAYTEFRNGPDIKGEIFDRLNAEYDQLEASIELGELTASGVKQEVATLCLTEQFAQAYVQAFDDDDFDPKLAGYDTSEGIYQDIIDPDTNVRNEVTGNSFRTELAKCFAGANASPSDIAAMPPELAPDEKQKLYPKVQEVIWGR